MKIGTLILFIFCCLHSTVYSQQKDFEWRIGVSGGYTNYYGDLTPYRLDGLHNWDANRHLFNYNETYSPKYSYKFYLEKQLSSTIGLMFNYGNYHFGMSDRYVTHEGDLYVENPNFSRGLNFQNHTRDLGLSFVFKTDNDWFLPSNSLIAPYFTLGLGYIHFDVKGDLLDSNGQRYDQTLSGIIHDGIFETNLPDWNTELVNGYDQDSWYANFGLGFRIRLGSRVELFAQSDFLHTFTDFLDDASGRYRMEYDNDFQAYAAKPGTNVIDPESPYRGHPDGAKDWIIYHGVGLKFNFGASKKTFNAPRLSPYSPDKSVKLKEALKSDLENKQDSLARSQSGVTNNYFYSVQLIETEMLDSLTYATKILGFEQEIQKRETQIVNGKTSERRLLEISRNFESQFDSLEKDSRLDPREKQDLLQASEKARFNVRYSIDSLNRRQKELSTEIDSIAELKKTLPLTQRVLIFPNENNQFETKRTVSDSVFQKTAISSESIDSQSLANSSVDETKTEKAETRSIAAFFSQETQPNERLTQMEQENRYLKSERDRVLREYNDYLKSNKKPKQKPQYVQSTRTIQKENTNTVVQEDPQQRRRRWWWPFAAAGGVATVVALSDNNDRGNDNPPIDSAAVVQEFLGREEMILAVSSAMLGVDIRNNGEKVEPKIEVPDTVFAVETITDTVYVDNKPVITLIKSKEILYFKLNQKVPDAEETAKLTQLGEFINDHEEYRLVITGFADNTGNVNFNLRLAEERMKSVADFLKNEFGLSEDQLRLESGGQVIRGNRQAANDLDRRVEVRTEKK
jgi:outer membrane protein OmpA-like peptidoglycan-associated protein